MLNSSSIHEKEDNKKLFRYNAEKVKIIPFGKLLMTF